MYKRWLLVAVLCCPMLSGYAAVPVDPLDSSQWPTMHALYFQDQPVLFDEAVKLIVPPEAEDSMSVPVAVNYVGLTEVEEVLVFIDYNPIPKVLQFYPEHAGPFLGFRVRLQQASPIRAAVRTRDGIWHVNGRWVDAAGGGCTLPSLTASGVDEDAIGRVHGRLWTRADGSRRLRLHITHPNDTGLVPGTPAFYVEELNLTDSEGIRLAQLKLFEPIAENPLLSLDIEAGNHSAVQVTGRDNNGLRIQAELQ